MLSLIGRLKRDTSANIALTTGLAILPIIVVVGMAFDMSMIENRKRDLQDALDFTLLSAAPGDLPGFSARADDYFETNTYDLDSVRPTVNVSYDDSGTRILYNGQASATVPTTFQGLIGRPSVTVTVSSQVSAAKGDASQGCIWLTSSNKSQALLLNNGADIVAAGCKINVASTASNAAVFNSGITLDTDTICVASNSVLNNYGPIDQLETGCAAEPEPFGATIPQPTSNTCTYSNINISGSTTLNPGTYCGWVNFNTNSTNTITFNPGLYIIKNGGWNVNGGKWRGTGVSFYYADTSKIQFNSAVDFNVDPPTSGTYKDLIFFEKKGLSNSQFVLDDSKGFKTKGLIWLPSRGTTWNSGAQLTSNAISMVFNSLILNNVNWELEPGVDAGGSGSGTSIESAGLRIER
ncbi:MAG: pilus assembly protein TadG-related protein [Hyphomonas sp.]|uniref:Tad domain-containing protein n=1 Tax=Hyphomonas sp. TaxID=87 RepID=UPI003526E41A